MYSQYAEDDIYIPLLPAVGRFLEIGAWHPTDKSNSRALYERGWSGILIEPSPGPLLNLLNEYSDDPRVQIISAVVAVEPGLVTLQVTDDAVSTADRSQYEAWKSVTKFRGMLTVPAISVNDLFSRFGGAFDFVSIDTEGTSVNIFAEMLRVGPRPRVVVCEHDSRFVELSQYAEQGNYRMIHENGTNRIYEWMGPR